MHHELFCICPHIELAAGSVSVQTQLNITALRMKMKWLSHFDKIQFHSHKRAAPSGTIYLRGLWAKAEWALCPDARVCLCTRLYLKLLLPLLILSSRALFFGGRWEEGGQLLLPPTMLPTQAALPMQPSPSASALASSTRSQVSLARGTGIQEARGERALERAAPVRQPEHGAELGSLPWDLEDLPPGLTPTHLLCPGTRFV